MLRQICGRLGGQRRQKLPFLPRKPENTTESQTDKHHFHRTGINAECQQKADNGNDFGGISRPFRQHKPADDKRHRRKVAKNVYREIQPTENKRSQRRKQCRRQPRRSNGKTPVCGKQRRTGRQQGKRQPSVKQRKYLTAKQCRIKNKLAVAPLKQSGIPAQDLRCTFNPVPIVVADKECNLIIQKHQIQCGKYEPKQLYAAERFIRRRNVLTLCHSSSGNIHKTFHLPIYPAMQKSAATEKLSAESRPGAGFFPAFPDKPHKIRH